MPSSARTVGGLLTRRLVAALDKVRCQVEALRPHMQVILSHAPGQLHGTTAWQHNGIGPLLFHQGVEFTFDARTPETLREPVPGQPSVTGHTHGRPGSWCSLAGSGRGPPGKPVPCCSGTGELQ